MTTKCKKCHHLKSWHNKKGCYAFAGKCKCKGYKAIIYTSGSDLNLSKTDLKARTEDVLYRFTIVCSLCNKLYGSDKSERTMEEHTCPKCKHKLHGYNGGFTK